MRSSPLTKGLGTGRRLLLKGYGRGLASAEVFVYPVSLYITRSIGRALRLVSSLGLGRRV